MDKIIAAAIIKNGVVYFVPPPGRHHDVINKIAKHINRNVGSRGQGFLTSTFELVGRLEAADIALMSNQIENPKWGPLLYSEDLW